MFLEDPRDRNYDFKYKRGQTVYFFRGNKITEGIVIFGRKGNRKQAGYWLGITGTSKELSKRESELFETIHECAKESARQALEGMHASK